MQPTIISDTSCLILLEKIEQLDLLKKLFGEVVTTTIVAAEFGKVLPEWFNIQDPNDKRNQLVLETSLDKGEASAICRCGDARETAKECTRTIDSAERYEK